MSKHNDIFVNQLCSII